MITSAKLLKLGAPNSVETSEFLTTNHRNGRGLLNFLYLFNVMGYSRRLKKNSWIPSSLAPLATFAELAYSGMFLFMSSCSRLIARSVCSVSISIGRFELGAAPRSGWLLQFHSCYGFTPLIPRIFSFKPMQLPFEDLPASVARKEMQWVSYFLFVKVGIPLTPNLV